MMPKDLLNFIQNNFFNKNKIKNKYMIEIIYLLRLFPVQKISNLWDSYCHYRTRSFKWSY